MLFISIYQIRCGHAWFMGKMTYILKILVLFTEHLLLVYVTSVQFLQNIVADVLMSPTTHLISCEKIKLIVQTRVLLY